MSLIRRNNRCNRAQLEHLVHFIRCHPDLAHNSNRTIIGQQRSQQLWEQVKSELNEMGPSKTIEQWRITWRDLKTRAKSANASVHRARLDKSIISLLARTSSGGLPKISEKEQSVQEPVLESIEVAVPSSEELGPLVETELAPSSPSSTPVLPATNKLIRVLTVRNPKNVPIKEETTVNEVFENQYLPDDNDESCDDVICDVLDEMFVLDEHQDPLSNNGDSVSEFNDLESQITDDSDSPLTTKIPQTTQQCHCNQSEKLKNMVESTDKLKTLFYKKKLQSAVIEKQTNMVNYRIALKKAKLVEMELKIKEFELRKLRRGLTRDTQGK